jgi:hypothetical protein
MATESCKPKAGRGPQCKSVGAEKVHLPARNTVLLGAQFLMFRRIILPSSSHSNSILLRLLDRDDKDITTLQNIRIYASDTASHPITHALLVPVFSVCWSNVPSYGVVMPPYPSS